MLNTMSNETNVNEYFVLYYAQCQIENRMELKTIQFEAKRNKLKFYFDVQYIGVF